MKDDRVLQPLVGTRVLPFIRIYVGEEFLRSVQITPGIWLVGRDLAAQIPLEGLQVSRKHCQIEFQGEGKLTVQDLDSKLGTMVNGEKVTRAPLKHGDVITIGPIHFKIIYPTGEAKIIPFPKIRTDPKIDLAALEKRGRVTTPPSDNIQALGIALMVFTAGVLAYGLHSWKKQGFKLPEISFLKAPPPPPTLPELRIASQPPPQVPRNNGKKNTIGKEESEEGLSERLVKSIGRIDKVDLNEIDSQNIQKHLPDSRRNTVSLKIIRTEKLKSIDVDIIIPEISPALPSSLSKLPPRQYDPQKYQSMLRDKIVGLERCYIDHVKGGSGKVSLWFSIAGSGAVRSSGIRNSSFSNTPFHKCMIKRVKNTQFDPPPWDGFVVTYAFHFGGTQEIRF